MLLATAIKGPTPVADKNRVAKADQHADRTAQSKDCSGAAPRASANHGSKWSKVSMLKLPGEETVMLISDMTPGPSAMNTRFFFRHSLDRETEHAEHQQCSSPPGLVSHSKGHVNLVKGLDLCKLLGIPYSLHCG